MQIINCSCCWSIFFFRTLQLSTSRRKGLRQQSEIWHPNCSPGSSGSAAVGVAQCVQAAAAAMAAAAAAVVGI